MRALQGPLAALVLLVLAATGYPGADLAGLAARAVRERAPGAGAPAAPGLPWLHVEHPAAGRPYIADPQGRQVILRGAVAAGLVDWWSGRDPADLRPPPYFPIDPAAYAGGACPPNSDLIRVPPLCQDDFAQMRGLGFDVVRLGLSWSLLEPAPDRYDATYLDRVAQIVGWAREAGIYVILDMHQDGYSRFLPRPAPPPLPGGVPPALHDHDGAPAWAVETFGLPSEKFIGQREMNPAVGAAFTAFWLNLGGLQERYLAAVAELARRFRDDSAVAGYNLYNEPWPGFSVPPLFDDLALVPFYRRAVDALTGVRDGLPCPGGLPLAACGHADLGVHTRQLLFVEADHLREQADFDLQLPQSLSSYPNVVFAIHAYTHKFSLDAIAGLPASSYPPRGYELSYASAESAARSLDAALFVTEFGNEPALDSSLLASQESEQERHLAGATYWPWKENCDVQPTWGVYEGVFEAAGSQKCAYDTGSERAPHAPQNGCLRQSKERLLARVWPRAFSGRLDAYRYDPQSGAFQLRGAAAAGAADTIVYVPPEVRGAATAEGAATLAVEGQSDGSRLLRVTPHGGAYQVLVASAPLALSGCA